MDISVLSQGLKLAFREIKSCCVQKTEQLTVYSTTVVFCLAQSGITLE